MTALAPTLQAFFTDRLRQQRHASDETVRAYRDTWRLLLEFAATQTGTQPSSLDIGDIDSDLIAAFLDHLEHDRHNSVRTRNARLSAIHSLFHFAAARHPEHAATISRVLAMPSKRFDRALVTYLTTGEVDALLTAPDPTTWTGRRDRAFMLLMVQTGLCVSELIALRRSDIHLGAGAHIASHGKGRKDRITPLAKPTVDARRDWLAESPSKPTDPIFPTRTGKALSCDAVERRLTRHQRVAAPNCPSLNTKHITAHVLRHTAAPARSRSRHHRHRPVARTRTRRHHRDIPARPPRNKGERLSPAPHHPTSKSDATAPNDPLLAFLEGL
jgi:integrase/recombinase XerD